MYCGIPEHDSFELALELRNFMCDEGAEIMLYFNRKPQKTALPAKKHGFVYDSTFRRALTTEKKMKKNVTRIDEALESHLCGN